MSSEPLLAFRAGRSFRREGTNYVDASPAKGAVLLYNEDGLLHFKWRNRTTSAIEEVVVRQPDWLDGETKFHFRISFCFLRMLHSPRLLKRREEGRMS